MKKRVNVPKDLVKMVIDALGGDRKLAKLWWKTENPLLGGLTPRVALQFRESMVRRMINDATRANELAIQHAKEQATLEAPHLHAWRLHSKNGEEFETCDCGARQEVSSS